jgi:hypothetical protein
MVQINASIALHQDRIWCTYRTRNLYQFDSISYIAELNDDLEQIADRRLIAENGNTAFEDVRLYSAGSSLFAFYTYFPFDGKGSWDWVYGVGFGKIDINTGIIKNQVSLRPLSKRYHEKNWIPYVSEGILYMITDFDPFLRIIKIGVLEFEPFLEEVYFSDAITLGWAYGEVRGGTPLLQNPHDGLLYGFVHSYLLNYMGFKRYYYYTVIRFNPATKTIELHPEPLSYEDEEPDEDYKDLWDLSNNCSLKVIFPIGIMLYDDGVLVSFGKDDVCSFTNHFSWIYLMTFFKSSR